MVTSSRQVSFMIIKDVNDDEIDEDDGRSPPQGKCLCNDQFMDNDDEIDYDSLKATSPGQV